MLSKRFSRRIVFSLVTAALWLAQPGPPTAAQTIPTPESVLGHKPGDDFYLANYEESLGYFRKLASATDKLQLRRVGKTSEGRDWFVALISSPENLRNYGRYQNIARRVAEVRGLTDEDARRLAREGKVIVHIDGGLHATEVANAQHTIQIAYDLVSRDKDPNIQAILENVILVLWFSMNPDGQDMTVNWYRRNLGTPYETSALPWLYQKYVGHDNNRDGYMNNMIESQVATRATLREFFPMIFLCHHQTAPFPTRIWIPPFAEPVSSNVHPLIWRWINLIGTSMAAYLEQHGMPGATHQGRGFDNWYPGYNDAVGNYRNMMSFWTETALYRYATPHFYTVLDFPKEFQQLRKEVLYPSPWQGGWWRLGDAVRYMIGASMSILDTAARYREDLIFNRYQTGRDTVQRFRREPPFAYVIPQEQRDPQTAALLLEKVQFNGIDVSQATAPFTVNGREYPSGTWAVLMDQPYALLIKELFEIQHYPDLREAPDGPLDLPYDVAGWTLPLQMGVEVTAVTSPLTDEVRGKFRTLDRITVPSGTVEGAGPLFVLGPQSNVAFKAINRLLKAGASVTRSTKEMTLGKTHFEPGAFLVQGADVSRIGPIAEELGLHFLSTGSAPTGAGAIHLPRIGLYTPWTANGDAGWTSWILEQHEFPFSSVYNAQIQAGHLHDQFDVVVFADMSSRTIMDGHKEGTIPGEFAGGIGETGLAALKEFLRDGGTLLMIGNSTIFAIEQFHLPVKNVLQGLKSEDFFCAGSILKTELKDSNHPVSFGMAQEPAVFFDRNPAFEIQKDFKGTVLLAYPTEDNPLLSGFLLHPEKIKGKSAALVLEAGKGKIVLLGFRPQWRGQSHGTYKLLFNSLFLSPQ